MSTAFAGYRRARHKPTSRTPDCDAQTWAEANGINSAITCWNAYAHWLASPDTKCGPGCKHPKLTRLKEPQNNLAVYSERQIHRLVAYKPNKAELRTHLIMLFLFDVGARISEVLSLCADAIDFDNLLVRLHGKGDKTRIVPFSVELRKRLVRYIADAPGNRLVFATEHPRVYGRAATGLARCPLWRSDCQRCLSASMSYSGYMVFNLLG